MIWQPTAKILTLKQRAKILAQIREFFSERNVLEVETPLMANTTVTDPFIRSISAGQAHFLQTSPEYAMKRLLAAGSGDIFQICKAFRDDDAGKLHNPEFTMLEWYRLGFDHHDLMNEMDELLQLILKKGHAERKTYSELFEKYLGLNPHFATLEEIVSITKKHIQLASEVSDRNTWLDLLFTHCIEPHIGQERPIFIYDFPSSQAALAKIRDENPPVASRFEVYFKGIELANGFHELQDAHEQRKRFQNDLQFRVQNQLESLSIDEKFIGALEHGLPECAGVALGIDRLVMLALECQQISDVLFC